MTTQMFKANRRMLLAGRRLEAGEVIDLFPLGLPSGRAMQLIQQRRGEFVQQDQPDTAPMLSLVPEIDMDEVQLSAPVVVDWWSTKSKDELLRSYDETSHE
jgi:hypothetical protein